MARTIGKPALLLPRPPTDVWRTSRAATIGLMPVLNNGHTGVWWVGPVWDKTHPRPRHTPAEDVEQASFVAVARRQGLRLHSTPNEAASSRARGAAFVKTGLSRGVPDLYVWRRPADTWRDDLAPYPPETLREQLASSPLLALEFKRANATVSKVRKEQWSWLESLSGESGVPSFVVAGQFAGLCLLNAAGLLQKS